MDKIEKLLALDEFIYFLGYLWADGSVPRKRKEITLSIQQEDGEIMKNNFVKINTVLNKPFSTSFNKPKMEHWKTMMRFYSGDYDLYNFLVENDYCDKSHLPPSKILNLLSVDKHPIFYLGFFDGDGCIYNGEKTHSLYSFSFTGPYDYNWNFLEKLLDDLNISFKICRRIRNKGSNSSITSTGMFNMEKLYTYMYSNIENFSPLERKKIKFEEIIEHVKTQTSKEKGVCYYNGKYMAYLTINNNQILLGTFDQESDAIKIRKAGVKMYELLSQQFKIAPDCSLLSK